MNDNIRPPRPRFVISIVEFIVVVAILTFLFALLFPAVNCARETHGQAIILAPLNRWVEPHPWFFVFAFTAIVTLILTSLLLVLRAILPYSAKGYIQWHRNRPQKKAVDLPKCETGLPAIWSTVMAITGTALLIFSALHVRVDRSNRRPVITWEGPFAGGVVYIAMFAWLLSFAAAWLATYALQRCESRSNVLAYLAIFFSSANFVCSFFFWCVISED